MRLSPQEISGGQRILQRLRIDILTDARCRVLQYVRDSPGRLQLLPCFGYPCGRVSDSRHLPRHWRRRGHQSTQDGRDSHDIAGGTGEFQSQLEAFLCAGTVPEVTESQCSVTVTLYQSLVDLLVYGWGRDSLHRAVIIPHPGVAPVIHEPGTGCWRDCLVLIWCDLDRVPPIRQWDGGTDSHIGIFLLGYQLILTGTRLHGVVSRHHVLDDRAFCQWLFPGGVVPLRPFHIRFNPAAFRLGQHGIVGCILGTYRFYTVFARRVGHPDEPGYSSSIFQGVYVPALLRAAAFHIMLPLERGDLRTITKGMDGHGVAQHPQVSLHLVQEDGVLLGVEFRPTSHFAGAFIPFAPHRVEG